MTLKQKTILLHDGFRVSYLEAGPRIGPPLVFLHGFSVSALAYSEMLELLAETGFRVIALDAPDHGGTDALPWGHTVDDMVSVIDEALGDIIGCSKPAHIVGHSMGGSLAIHLAALRPGLVWSLTLLDPAAGAAHHEQVSIDPLKTLPRRAAQFLSGAVRDIVGDAKRAGSVRVLRERLSLINRLGKSVSGPSMVKAGYALMLTDTVVPLARIKQGNVPTMVIHGALDNIVPRKAALDVAQKSGAGLKILGGHYHSWMIADPEKAADLIVGNAIDAGWKRIARDAEAGQLLANLIDAVG